MPYIQCHNISKTYPSERGAVEALGQINIEIKQGEFVCLIGPSGCGKTTLLKLLAGLEQPTSGNILLEKYGTLVFQEHGLFPWMTILDNAAFGLEMQGLGKKERQKRALLWLQKQGLGAFALHYPHQLSGGMRQRVAIARAVLSDNGLLLMDEPFGALDAQTRFVLQGELLQLWREEKKTIVYVTHDIDEAILLADRIVVMSSRPGMVLREIPITHTRPRAVFSDEIQGTTSLKKEIWQMLEQEARRTLQVAD